MIACRIAFLMLAISSSAIAHECYSAELVRVVDGDTLEARIMIWSQPTTTVTGLVRLAGIDTPEKGWRGQCSAEQTLGSRATAFAHRWLSGEPDLTICNVRSEKFGRILADVVRNSDGSDLGADLVTAGLAKQYSGGKKQSWCEVNNENVIN